MSNPRLQVDIGANITELQKALKTVENRLSGFGKRLGEIGTTFSTRLTLPLVTAGGAAIKLASDFEESLNKVNVAFGNSSLEVEAFAKSTLDSFGIAEGSALDMAALFGDMATSMGISTGEASKMSTQLVGLAGDLASFKNISVDRAQTALAAIFTGETEALKSLGVVMTQANLEAFALSQGIQKNIQDMTQAEQVNLRFAYVMSKTTNAQGDFARTQGGAANQMRIFQESLKQLGQQFGSTILPLFTRVVKRVNEIVKVFATLDAETRTKIMTLGVALASLGPILVTLGIAVKTLAIAFGLLSSPITLAVAGFTTVGLSVKYIIDNWEALKARFTDWSWWRNAILDMAAFFARYAPGMLGGQGEAAAMGFEAMKTNVESTYPPLQTMGEFFSKTTDQIGEFVKSLLDIDLQFRNFGPSIQRGIVQPINEGFVPAIQKVPQQFKSATEATLATMGTLSYSIDNLKMAAEIFTEGFARGLSDIIVEGGKLKDMLKSIGKELLKSGLTKLFSALLTGGLTSGAGLLGSGGGLLGSIFPKIFGAGAPVSMGMATPQLSGANVTVGGQFVLKGTDLVGSIIRTNKSILR
jgi:hypothetical protein